MKEIDPIELLTLFGEICELLPENTLLKNKLAWATRTGNTRDLQYYLKSSGIDKLLEFARKRQDLLEKLVPFEPPENEKGDFPFATTIAGEEIGTKTEDMGKHTYLCACSGHGKTSVLRLLLEQLRNEVVLWIFDLKGIDFTDYAKKNFKILPLSQIPENPLDLPNFSTLFCQAYFLQSAAHVIDAEIETLKKKNPNPTLLDLAIQIDEKIKTTQIYREAALLNQISDRLHSLIREKSSAYSHPQTPDFEELYKPTVFVNDLEEQKNATFTCLCLFERVFRHHQENDFFGNEPRIIIAIEESNLLPPLRDVKLSGWDHSYLSNRVQISREIQIGWIFSSSQPIPESIALNCATKIIGAQNTGEQRFKLANTLGLNKPQRGYFSELETREFIIKTPSSPLPFVGISLDALPKTPLSREELRQACKDGLSQIMVREAHRETQPLSLLVLTPDEKAIIDVLADHPYLNQTQARSESGLNTDKFRRALNKLLQKKLICRQTVEQKTGYYYEITPNGKDLLGKSVYTGKGSFSHRFWQHEIANHYKEQNYKVRLENKGADLTATRDKEKLCIEVTFTLTNARDNIERNAYNFPGYKTIIVVKNENDIPRVKAILGEVTATVATLKEIMR